jgi:hypothetical protein
MQPTLFVPDPCEGVPIHNLFYFMFSKEQLKEDTFGEPPFRNYFETTASYTKDVERADAIVLPHNFTALSPAANAYITHWADEGERLNIPVYVFCFSDFAHELAIDPRVWVFLMSSYKSALRPRDIIVPTTARSFADLPKEVREKADRPIVSFCGFAGFQNWRKQAAYLLKNLTWDVRALGDPSLRARKLGIYWRRIAMHALRASTLVTTNFIVRRTFSGARQTIELSPAKARQEFIENVLQSDFVLAPKGDGNYSNRFLEALSLGRIPILIDTDVPLPAENEVPYEKIVVRVPMHEVSHTAEYVRRFYDPLSNEEWKERQRLARSSFLAFLDQERFFTNYFGRLSRAEQ